MFTKQIAAFVITASVIAAPAFAATTKSAAPAVPAKISAPASTMKVVKPVKLGKRHIHHVRGKHGKVVKFTHARKHHRAHVARNAHAPVKASGRI